jgi:hypothetical protein
MLPTEPLEAITNFITFKTIPFEALNLEVTWFSITENTLGSKISAIYQESIPLP